MNVRVVVKAIVQGLAAYNVQVLVDKHVQVGADRLVGDLVTDSAKTSVMVCARAIVL